MTALRPVPKTASLDAYPMIGDWLDFTVPGMVSARSGRVELGQGIAIALTAVVARALSLTSAQVQLVAGETRGGINENYTAGSMSVELGVQSLRAAAWAARNLVLGTAASRFEGAALELQDGLILQDGAPTDLDIWSVVRPLDLANTKITDLCKGIPVTGTDHAAPVAAAARDHIRARLTGGAFIHDIELPEMLHARVLHLPHPSARLLAFDDLAISALAGVTSVHRDGAFIAVLAQEEAQAMVAIAQADLAAQWAIPETGLNGADALLAFAAAPEVMVENGALPVGNRKIIAEVERPFLTHGSIGTCCALAQFQAGKLRVWSHSQGPFQLRAALTEALGLTADQVDVIHRPGAGCYGHNGADDVAFEAALLAMAYPERPIRLVWRRADEMTRGPLSPAMQSRVEITLGQDGRIAGLALDILSGPHQRRPGPGRPSFAAGPLLATPLPLAPATEPPATNGGGSDRNAVPPYKVGALRVSRRVAYDMPLRTSAMRSLGSYANAAAIELGMDAAADSIGADPVAFRLDHLEDPRAQAVIAHVAAMSGFCVKTDGTTAMGLGFSRYKNKAGYCAAVVEVTATDRLVVPRLWMVADVGEAIDPEGVLAQLEGGAIQTLSWSLKEEVPIVNGAAHVPDWEHYPILRFSELPDISVALIGSPDGPPLGAGEIAQGPVAGALACAVRRLFGMDKVKMPLTPDGLARMLLT